MAAYQYVYHMQNASKAVTYLGKAEKVVKAR